MADLNEGEDVNNNKFKLNSNDVLGVNYSMYCDEIRALALSNADKYFKLRKEVFKKVKADAIDALYGSFFNVLVGGKDIHGKPIGEFGRGDLIPCYPSNKANDFALEASRSLTKYINEIIDILLPRHMSDLAEDMIELRGAGASASDVAKL